MSRREKDVERIVERCAGLDVHKSLGHRVREDLLVRVGPHQEIREFATTTRGLLLLGTGWLPLR